MRITSDLCLHMCQPPLQEPSQQPLWGPMHLCGNLLCKNLALNASAKAHYTGVSWSVWKGNSSGFALRKRHFTNTFRYAVPYNTIECSTVYDTILCMCTGVSSSVWKGSSSGFAFRNRPSTDSVHPITTQCRTIPNHRIQHSFWHSFANLTHFCACLYRCLLISVER
jgi:hypothetical protein